MLAWVGLLCLLWMVVPAKAGRSPETAGKKEKETVFSPADVRSIGKQGNVVPLPVDEAEPGRVVASGVATIYGGDVEGARKAALRAAYAEAVSRGCGVEIGSLMVIRNVKQVNDIITSRSSGFIRTYDIRREGVVQGNPSWYEVLIEAEVAPKGSDAEDREQALRLYLELLDSPRLLVILPEVVAGVPSGGPPTVEASSGGDKVSVGSSLTSLEAAMARAFSEYGYQVVTSDDLMVQRSVDARTLQEAKAGVTAQALVVARAVDADLALVGVLRSQPLRREDVGVTVYFAEAELSAKALVVSNGKLVKAFHRLEKSTSADPMKARVRCLEKAAAHASEELAWDIPGLLLEDARITRLTVHGVDEAGAEKVRGALNQAQGVLSVRFSKIPTAQRNVAEYQVETGFVRLPPEAFVELCSTALEGTTTLSFFNKYQIELLHTP